MARLNGNWVIWILAACLLGTCLFGWGPDNTQKQDNDDHFPSGPFNPKPKSLAVFGEALPSFVRVERMELPLFEPWHEWSYTNNMILKSRSWIDTLVSWHDLNPEFRYRKCPDKESDNPRILAYFEMHLDSVVVHYRLVDNYSCLSSDVSQRSSIHVLTNEQWLWYCKKNWIDPGLLDNYSAEEASAKWRVSRIDTLVGGTDWGHMQKLEDPIFNNRDEDILQRLALKYDIDSCAHCICEWTASNEWVLPVWCADEKSGQNAAQLLQEGSCGLDSGRYNNFLMEASRLGVVIGPEFSYSSSGSR